MKQLLYRLLFGCMTLLLLAACEADNAPFENNTDGSNCIILNMEASSVPVRATVAGNDKENAVDHIDVFVFNTDNTLYHHERLQLTAANAGKAALTKKRSEFGIDAFYKVYIVANSNLNNFADVKKLDDLKGKYQEDQAIHLTGLSNLEGVPQFFLMDGIATVDGQEAGTDNTVKLNFGNKADNTELKVNLKRAAAKILVHMIKGPQVVFSETIPNGAGYYMRNLPYASTVLSGIGKTDKLITNKDLISTEYFAWSANEITVTAYAYEHAWENTSTLQKEPRLIVNIPLTYTPEGETKSQEIENSYYQIPVSRDKVLDRNTCYETTVTINAPGGTDPSEPLTLQPINYTVSDWVVKPINVGGDTDRPAYLTLNEYAMEMHNMVEDNTTLEFASSSAVKATIDRVYYIDKFGQEKDLEINPATGKYGEKYTTGWYPVVTHWKNECTIRITPDENITGKIDVYGDVPENKTVRYIEFTVTNEEGIERQVKVAQYPLEYITNKQSWYSYRDDFKTTDSRPTTYDYAGDRIYGISLNTRNISNWNGQYDYEISQRSSNTSAGFFRSKVVTNVDNNGESTIKYYYWNIYNILTTISSQEYNGRLYHVVLTASSDKYTIGKPRLIEDSSNPGLMVTDPGVDNAELVSPSFMIASSLGGFNLGAGNLTLDDSEKSLRVAREHCANYVEIAEDGTKYDDWRLPTEAELKIIIDFQGKENENADAIDYLLNAQYYYSASGRVVNPKKNMNGTGVRCIRDVYGTKK